MEQLYKLFKKFLSFTLIVVGLSGISAIENEMYEKIRYNLDDAPKLFDDFVKKYNKTYLTEVDREEHYEAFRKELKFLNEYNFIYEWPLVIDEFSDYTSKDFEIFRHLSEEVNASKWFDHRTYYNEDDFPKLFEKFKKIYDRNYKNDEEEKMRFEWFKIHLARLNHFNEVWLFPQKYVDETYDYTNKEMAKYWDKKYPDLKNQQKLKSSNEGLPPAPPRLYKKNIYNLDDLERIFEDSLNDPNFPILTEIKNEENKKQRFEIFKENVQLINELNEHFLGPFTITENAFLTKKERYQQRKLKKAVKKFIPFAPLPDLSGTQHKKIYNLKDINELFEDCCKRHLIHFEDNDQKKSAFQAFQENVKQLNWLNEKFSGVFGINKFTAYTNEELNDFIVVHHKKQDSKEQNKLKPENRDHDPYIHWQKK